MHDGEVHYALLKYSWERQEFILRRIHREENRRSIGYGREGRVVHSGIQNWPFLFHKVYFSDGVFRDYFCLMVSANDPQSISVYTQR